MGIITKAISIIFQLWVVQICLFTKISDVFL